jgi:translation initiation factor IF-3
VIGENAEQLGIMTPEDALEKARAVGLDLVEVAATSRPPVCRIMDYGRYKYEQKKKRTGKSKQAHAASLKEIKLRPGTDMHDLNFKLNNARRFLMDGDKVKVTVMFRGREMVHTYRGREQLKQVIELLGPIAKMENAPRMEGRFMSMILVADREVVAEAKRAEESEQPEVVEDTSPSAKAERRARKLERQEHARYEDEHEDVEPEDVEHEEVEPEDVEPETSEPAKDDESEETKASE